MKIAAIILFVLFGLTTLMASANIFMLTQRPNFNPANLAGYACGSFLIPGILLIVASFMWGKATAAKDNKPDDNEPIDP